MVVINWCLAHWDAVLTLAVVLLSVLNAATEHYDGASGVRHFALWALDWISALRSGQSAKGEGTPRLISALKVPLLQLSPPQDRIARRVAEIKEARRG